METKNVAWMSCTRLGASKKIGGMGFRDLELFNLELLAKQGWSLLKHPESLVARVMKDKYFLHGDFLEASLGYKPSYAWRSIFQARGGFTGRDSMEGGEWGEDKNLEG